MNSDQRACDREPVVMSVTLEDGTLAQTQDISADGLFLWVPHSHLISKWVHFEFSMQDIGMRFTATGEVLRCERNGERMGVALRWHSPALTRTGG